MIQEQQEAIANKEKELILIEELLQKTACLYKGAEQIIRKIEKGSNYNKQKTKKNDKLIFKKAYHQIMKIKYQFMKKIKEEIIKLEQIVETLRISDINNNKAIFREKQQSNHKNQKSLILRENNDGGKGKNTKTKKQQNQKEFRNYLIRIYKQRNTKQKRTYQNIEKSMINQIKRKKSGRGFKGLQSSLLGNCNQKIFYIMSRIKQFIKGENLTLFKIINFQKELSNHY